LRVILAVDFGTSNSLATVATARGHSQPLPLDDNAPDPTVFRTLLFFPNSETCFYGQRAIFEYQENQGNGRFIRSIKKFLPSQSFVGSWIENRVVKLEDLVGLFLLEMKKRAEAIYGQKIDKILLGRPAQYSEDATADKLAVYRMTKASEFAGFKETYFFEEPLAAALDYKTTLKDWKTVLVVDLGGGTSDFTVMKIGPAAFQPSHVLAKGAVSIAGDVMDGRCMAEIFAPDFGSEVKYRVPLGSNILTMPRSLLEKICSPADIAQLMKNDYMHFLKQVENWALGPNDKKALQRLFVLCEDQLGFAFFEKIEELKKALGERETYEFNFPYPDIELKRDVPREQFAAILDAPVQKIFAKMNEVLSESGLQPNDIDVVYCTGGTSRLPQIQNGLIEKFGSEKVKANKYFHSVIDGLGVRATEILIG
jgi:hypothetical chaperone protein